ncbi:MAG: hypothetical protein IKY82_02365 [Alistipes sp.]|nr:hypothetical protein [Alistipes sp.]
MKGIRKRVTIGFLSIVVLLFFSGLVSLFELNNMSGDIDAILGSSRRSISSSESLLDAVRAHDRAVIHYAVLRDARYADSCNICYNTFVDKIRLVREESASSATTLFDSLDMLARSMHNVVEQLQASRVIEYTPPVLPDSLATEENKADSFDGWGWYSDNYLPEYDAMSDGVLRVMTSSQSSLSPRAELLSRNAYRAVTPVFISLVVMIAILLMFYYFVVIYIAKPIVEMNKNLGDSLKYKIPFQVKSECLDEVNELKQRIESIINNRTIR